MELKTRIRQALLQHYEKYGISAVRPKAEMLIKQCEHEKIDYRQRVELKGELAEVVLECYLAEYSKYITPSVVSKGLCIRNMRNSLTTEMDVTFFTPCRVYMFECKSYSGKKVLTAECTLTNNTTSKDVFGQSKHHMEILNQYIAQYRVNTRLKGVSPYKLVLFELSSQDCEDQRDDKWKQTIPLITLSTLDEWLQAEFSREMKVNWDVRKMIPMLKRLDMESAALFKKHLKRLEGIK